ncbi:MAG: electron transport complex subunit RsxE [Granulosicoccus sp.]
MNSPPTKTSIASLWFDGLWRQNPGLVKLLGLCPLLAVSNTTINGLALGIATLLTLLTSNLFISSLRHHLLPSIRLPLEVLIIATAVTTIEIMMAAWLPGIHAALGIFLPLIVTNCLILGRAEAFASRRSVAAAAHDALAMGCGFLLVLVLMGATRELIGQGTILSGAHMLFGVTANAWTIHLFSADHGLLLALLPPGAFIVLGLILAVKNLIDARLKTRSAGFATVDRLDATIIH